MVVCLVLSHSHRRRQLYTLLWGVPRIKCICICIRRACLFIIKLTAKSKTHYFMTYLLMRLTSPNCTPSSSYGTAEFSPVAVVWAKGKHFGAVDRFGVVPLLFPKAIRGQFTSSRSVERKGIQFVGPTKEERMWKSGSINQTTDTYCTHRYTVYTLEQTHTHTQVHLPGLWEYI